jgi:Tn3 transposase DDE domain-containing protein
VLRRWGILDLLDLLKHADVFTDFTGEFTSVASREITDRTVLRRRLLFVLFALGTNMGIKHVVDGAVEAGRPPSSTSPASSRPRRATRCLGWRRRRCTPMRATGGVRGLVRAARALDNSPERSRAATPRRGLRRQADCSVNDAIDDW